jgi:hypothetical protein
LAVSPARRPCRLLLTVRKDPERFGVEETEARQVRYAHATRPFTHLTGALTLLFVIMVWLSPYL